MLEPPELPEPSPGRIERKAVWWAWPTILLSVFFIGWSVNLYDSVFGDDEASEPAESRDPAELAIFELESRLIIAMSRFSADDARQTLDQMRGRMAGDRALVSLTILEFFIDQSTDGLAERMDERLSDKAPEVLRVIGGKAITEGLSEAERGELAKEIGWFSKLAPAPDLTASPFREAIVEKSTFTLLVMGICLFVGLLAIFSGFVLLVLYAMGTRRGWLQNQFDPSVSPRGLLAEVFALYLGGMALGELLGLFVAPIFSPISFVASMILPLFWPRFRGVSWREFFRALGVTRGRGVWREIVAGAVGYLGVIAIASVGILMTLILTAIVNVYSAVPNSESALIWETASAGLASTNGPEVHPLVGWIYNGGIKERLLALLLAAVMAPLVEELFFRGAIYRHLRGHWRFLGSALISGLIFAALHPQGWMAIPALTAMGVGFSLLREWRDSLVAPMVAHAINNGALVGVLCLLL